jgi:hypothetical protein
MCDDRKMVDRSWHRSGGVAVLAVCASCNEVDTVAASDGRATSSGASQASEGSDTSGSATSVEGSEDGESQSPTGPTSSSSDDGGSSGDSTGELVECEFGNFHDTAEFTFGWTTFPLRSPSPGLDVELEADCVVDHTDVVPGGLSHAFTCVDDARMEHVAGLGVYSEPRVVADLPDGLSLRIRYVEVGGSSWLVIRDDRGIVRFIGTRAETSSFPTGDDALAPFEFSQLANVCTPELGGCGDAERVALDIQLAGESTLVFDKIPESLGPADEYIAFAELLLHYNDPTDCGVDAPDSYFYFLIALGGLG